MYTQHPILTEKHRIVDILQIFKKEKLKYHMVLSIQTLNTFRTHCIYVYTRAVKWLLIAINRIQNKSFLFT